MSQKAEIIAGTAHRIGGRVEDLYEAAKREVARWEGQKEGALKCAKLIESLLGHLQKELDDEKMSIEDAAKIKGWVARALSSCDGAALQASNLQIAAQGQVQGLERAVALLKQEFDTARSAIGVERHPGPSIKEERDGVDA